MTVLEKKSKQNWEASLISREKGLYSPAIHSTYYSILQNILAILESGYLSTFKEISRLSREHRSSSHNHCIETIRDELRKKEARADSASFLSKIRDLKNFRENADYSNTVEIFDRDVEEALSLSSDIRSILKKNF